MRLSRRKYPDRTYGFSVPLRNYREKTNKDVISQEITSTNTKARQKKHDDTISKKFLVNLKKYMTKQKRKVYYQTVIKPVNRFMQEMKKESYRYNDSQHPDYKKVNMYRYSYFKDHILMRSSEGLTAGLAWGALIKCWIGFKDAYGSNNEEGMLYYARGIQKYLYLLEEIQPDFSNIGLKPYKEFL